MSTSENGVHPFEIDYETLRQVTQMLSAGIAIVEPQEWSVLFENANFFAWFPPESDADEPLTIRLPGFNAERAVDLLRGSGISSGYRTNATAGPLIFIWCKTLGCSSPKMPMTFLGPRQILP